MSDYGSSVLLEAHLHLSVDWDKGSAETGGPVAFGGLYAFN